MVDHTLFIELALKSKRRNREKMSDTNDSMDFILDEVYQRLIDCKFGLDEPELAMGWEEKAVGTTPRNSVNAGFRRVRYRRAEQKSTHAMETQREVCE